MLLFKPFTIQFTFLLCLFCMGIWWISPLWMIGVFDDGVFYSCISRNLVYDAQETIWDLKVSNALDSSFNGHPPLAFWLQAIFFKIVGEPYWVERVYSFICLLITILFIHKSWRILNKENSTLPIFFFTSVPIVGWCFANNMLENTLAILGTAAVYTLLKKATQNIYFSIHLLIAAFLIFGCVMVKGPVGLYPLATLPIYAFVYNRKDLLKSIFVTIFILVLMVAIFGFLFYFDARALQFFKRYYELQLLNSLSGGDSLAENRLFLLQCLFEELLLVVSFVLAGKLFVWKLSIATESVDKKQLVFWFLMACAASLPMLISPKQLRFYLVPSMVFYTLAFAIGFYPIFKSLYNYFQPFQRLKKLLYTTIYMGIACCLVLSILNIKKYTRNLDMLPDIFVLGTAIPAHTEVYLSPSLYKVWNFHAYMYRYFYIDLSTVHKNQQFALFNKKDTPYINLTKYKEEPLNLQTYKLYKLKEK